jgi:hypothetical protein
VSRARLKTSGAVTASSDDEASAKRDQNEV